MSIYALTIKGKTYIFVHLFMFFTIDLTKLIYSKSLAYSYLNASTGLIFTALNAGKSPEIAPAKNAKARHPKNK